MRLGAWAARCVGVAAIVGLFAYGRPLDIAALRECVGRDIERDKYGVKPLRSTGSGRYDLVYLGAFGGMMQPYHGASLNNRGDVCASYCPEANQRTVPLRLLKDGAVETMESEGLLVSGRARAINDERQVVGDMATPSGMCGFLWRKTSVVTLPPLPGYAAATGTSLNSRGEVAGYAYTPEEKEYWKWRAVACVWRSGKPSALPLPPECVAARAYGISEDGAVVGDAITSNGRTRAFVFVGGRCRLLPNLPGGTVSSAAAVNARGEIVGSCQRRLPPGGEDAFDVRPVLWRDGRILDLGLPKGFGYGKATSINAKSQIGVTAQLRHWDMGDTDFYKAFVWDPTVGIKSVNELADVRLGHHYSRAYSLNDDGSMLVQGRFLRRPWEQLQPFYLLVERPRR